MNNLPLLPKFNRLKAYIKPNIPYKKIKNALENYVHYANNDINEDDVLLLIDNTTFGSAKEGMLFTSTQFFYNIDGSGKSFGAISQIESIEIDTSLLGNSISFLNKEFENSWRNILLACSKDDIAHLKNYLLVKFFKYLEDEKEKAEQEKQHAEQADFDEEQYRLEIRKQLILEEEKRRLEQEQKAIPVQESNSHLSTHTLRVANLNSQQQSQSRYIGTRIDGGNYPEPKYVGEPEQEYELDSNDTLATQGTQNNQLVAFFQKNSDGIIAKLKESGLSLTSSALQNDENITRIATVVHNFLPGAIRFFIGVDKVEDFLLKNRHWLINKLNG